jgi:nucleoside-diphosphate-sugar epimerase
MGKLIVGCGYLGRRVLSLWQAAAHETGEKIYVTTRSPERAEQLSRAGVTPLVLDVTQDLSLAPPADIDTVLFAVGFDAKAGRPIHEVYVEGLSRVIDWLPNSVRRFIYISSTGVYGSFHGEWIDEDSPCEPVRDGGKACLAAERLLAASKFGRQSVALRLAGIYGPERIPRGQDLLAGKPLEADPSGYLNLIHVQDAARIVLLAEQNPTSACLLVSDGQPVVRGEYYNELARLLGAPPPQFMQPAGGMPTNRRGSADKRVSNAKLMKELAPTFEFPDYRAGLADAVAQAKMQK